MRYDERYIGWYNVSMWQKGCFLLIFAVMLTACIKPLATPERTPNAETTGGFGPRPTPVLTTEASTATESIAVSDNTEAAQTGSQPTPEESVTPVPQQAPGIGIVPATQKPISNNERWRQQQLDRVPLPEPQYYTTTGSALYWFDPVFQQAVLIGTFSGPFEVLATFRLRSTGEPALEVLYEVNKRYGLTAVSPSIVERIHAAGYGDVIDTYVLETDQITAP